MKDETKIKLIDAMLSEYYDSGYAGDLSAVVLGMIYTVVNFQEGENDEK